VKRSKTIRGKSNRPSEVVRLSQKISPRPLPSRPVKRSSPPDIELVVKHYRRNESSGAVDERKRLFLRVGDEVTHMHYEQWGLGVVMEIMTSSVPGGTCLARIRFQDGQLRCFNNDLDNQGCCYYFGVRRYWNPTDAVNDMRSKFFAWKG
jgi:hypothetical protein